ncbi:hypothetical protein DV738_g4783, partial [Chaetothyriales sp. CBS 135597]
MAMISLSVAAVLALAGLSNAQQNILDDTVFYGQSPYAAPPIANGTGDWAEAFAKAKVTLAELSLEEKVNLTGGIDARNGCSGNIPAIHHVGFHGMCLTDAGNGVRATDFVNGWPSGIHVGASWNKELTRSRAIHLGGEFRAKGVNVALGPVVGPIGRVALNGRNWEGFSTDPYLSGILSQESVIGIQSRGVIACTKHIVGNEQETDRNPSTDATTGQKTESVSANIDDRTMHELYLWPFQDAVLVGTGSIMCSYNRVNNSYGCQNSYLLNHLLKTELGYQGFVVSDWFAQHSGVGSANAGLDMVMPTGATFWAGNLTQAVTNGSVSEERIDDIATRILAAWYYTGQDDDFPMPGSGMPEFLHEPHEIVDARDPAAKPTLLQGAIEGHVLVKNTNESLPLRSPKLLSLYGYSATGAPINNPQAAGFGPWSIGTSSYTINMTNILCGFYNTPCTPAPDIAINGTLVGGGGSGAITPVYVSSPHDALVAYASEHDVALMWDYVNINETGFVNEASDACLVFINAWATEGRDRASLSDEYSDNLVNNIADQCANTIVIVNNAGIRVVDGFYSHPNVTAIIYSHLPGQDAGKALVSILFGETSPSGKLPYTVAKNESDYGSVLSPSLPVAPYEFFPQSDFSEGLMIDYRAFDAQEIEPRFEFGFGLTYTTFEYSDLSVGSTDASTAAYPTGEILPGGKEDLWDNLFLVSVKVHNTGSEFSAAEIAQLYVTIPGSGMGRQLRGFAKTEISPGASAELSFALTRRDLSMWDVVAQDWKLPAGVYLIEVGASSRNLPLNQTVTIA